MILLSMNHDDGCRCMACCAEKFKTIDPAAFGAAAERLQAERDTPATALADVLARLDGPARDVLQQVLRAIDAAVQGA